MQYNILHCECNVIYCIVQCNILYCIADDKNSCAMYMDCIAYDKHSCTMYWDALLMLIVVQCTWIALLIIRIVEQCNRIE